MLGYILRMTHYRPKLLLELLLAALTEAAKVVRAQSFHTDSAPWPTSVPR